MAATDLDEVRSVTGALLDARGLTLVDVELEGSGRSRTLRLLVEGADGQPVDLETLAQASTPISAALDAVDVITGPYRLEVSSPGLERPLRAPQDFRRFVGTTITLKSSEPVSGARRHRGMLRSADDEGVSLVVDGEERHFGYSDIASARTVFEWGPAPKPTGRPRKRATAAQSAPESAGERSTMRRQPKSQEHR